MKSNVLWGLIVFIVAGCSPFQKDDTKTEKISLDKPNILFISVDDLRPELGAYGNEQIKSPHIDKLASEGFVFKRAYCQQSVCSPSRISVMTGLRPDSTFIYDNKTHHRNKRPNVVTLAQQFKENGYHTVNYGKLFHGHMGKFNDGLSWSEPWYYPPQNYTTNLRGYLDPKNVEYTNKVSQNGKLNFSGPAVEGMDVSDEAYPDGMTAKTVLENLPQLKNMNSQGKPFFLAFGIEKPHLPFLAPKKYWDLYDRESISLPEQDQLPKGAPQLAGANFSELRSYTDIPKSGPVTHEKAKELVHGYYACVSYTDALIGKVIDGLKEQGLYENTIIVVWGDHGWKLGDFGLWSKTTNYEIDTRVPLIFRVPKLADDGRESKALVELVDLFPTLCDLAGIPTPDILQGTSVKPIFLDENTRVKEAAFSQFPRGPENNYLNFYSNARMGYAMRTDKFRYVQWIDFKSREIVAEELYDLSDSQQETQNLAQKAEQAVQLDAARRIFDKYILKN